VQAGGGGAQGALGGVAGGGEGDPGGVEAVAAGGAGDQGAQGLVDGQVGPEFLAGQVRGAAAEQPARAAQGGLELGVPGLNRPPLMPVKRELSLA
jgi:hypothetical protein